MSGYGAGSIERRPRVLLIDQAHAQNYDGSILGNRHNMVVVVIQYRLDPSAGFIILR